MNSIKKIVPKKFFLHIRRAGFMNEAGEPKADVILAKLANKPEAKDVDSAVLKSLVDRCVKETGANSCQVAFKIYKCYREGLPAVKKAVN
jgi:hypothetical protein